MATRIEVPTLKQAPQHRAWLFELERRLHAGNLDIVFGFGQCRQLQPGAVAFLGGLARVLQTRRGSVDFDWASCSPKVLRNLQENGFSAAFGGPPGSGMGHAIPYREDSGENTDAIVDYLQENWLGRGWINISPLLSSAIVGRVWEIYANAFEHGRSEVGVITCGHHYSNFKELSLTVVDFGVGIPANVREYFGVDVRADQALRWAFQRGTTTKRDAVSRGIGLDLLKEFVKLNDGRLECFSGGGEAVVTRAQESFVISEGSFHGTLLTITFRCDDRFYRFASEQTAVQAPLF